MSSKRRNGRPDRSHLLKQRLSQELRISHLEKRLQNLEAAFGQNTEVFAGGFDIADMRIYACMRILNETHGAFPIRKANGPYLDEGGFIDFMKYYGEYLAMLGFQMLARTYAEQPAPKPVVDEDHALVFGGDIT